MLICGVLVFPSLIFAQIQNGDFETPDPNSPEYIIAPAKWTRIPLFTNIPVINDCYAALHTDFVPDDGRLGWEISHPFEGNTFVLLSTGGFDIVSDGSIIGASISQEVFLSPGDTIMGAYFFGTVDYRPYNDSAKIYLRLTDPNNFPNSEKEFVIPESQCDVETVGSYQSTLHLSPDTDGWISFSYTVEPNQIGPYDLRCEVVDIGDTIYPSYYALDNLRICRNGQSLADLNDDCHVNMMDFSILSEAWLAFCPDVFDSNTMDPNDIADPNIPCQLADIDNNGYVDPNDLLLMSGDWLR